MKAKGHDPELYPDGTLNSVALSYDYRSSLGCQKRGWTIGRLACGATVSKTSRSAKTTTATKSEEAMKIDQNIDEIKLDTPKLFPSKMAEGPIESEIIRELTVTSYVTDGLKKLGEGHKAVVSEILKYGWWQVEFMTQARYDSIYREFEAKEAEDSCDEQAPGAIGDVVLERQLQVEIWGYTPEQDDRHVNGELARAALNVFASVLLCLVAVTLGFIAAQAINTAKGA